MIKGHKSNFVTFIEKENYYLYSLLNTLAIIIK
jgi:hypothetical protein